MKCEEICLEQGGALYTYIMDPQTSFHVYKERPAMIICPGGAYLIHAVKESEPVALTFLQKGYSCFVLRYTVAVDRENPSAGVNEAARYPLQALQLLEAIRIVRRRAAEWHIDPDRIFLAGFSAGAHVCASAGTRWNDPRLTGRLPFAAAGQELRPSGMVLGYPMLALNPEQFLQEHGGDKEQEALVNKVLTGTEAPTAAQREEVNLVNFVSEATVPAFIWHSIDDPVIDCGRTLRFAERMLACGCRCELHLFDHGGHGMGLADELSAQSPADTDEALRQWVRLAQAFLKRQSTEQGGAL